MPVFCRPQSEICREEAMGTHVSHLACLPAIPFIPFQGAFIRILPQPCILTFFAFVTSWSLVFPSASCQGSEDNRGSYHFRLNSCQISTEYFSLRDRLRESHSLAPIDVRQIYLHLPLTDRCTKPISTVVGLFLLFRVCSDTSATRSDPGNKEE